MFFINPFRFNNTAGGLWTPAEITTSAWYDADDASTITESAGSVSQWDDKSGNSNHLTQSTGANQPITGTRTLGGLNVLDFDGSTDFMENSGIGSINSLFLVVAPDATINDSSDAQFLTSTVGDEITVGLTLGSSTSALANEVITMMDEDDPATFADRQGISSTNITSINTDGHIFSNVLTTDWFMGMDGSSDQRDLTSGTRNALDYSASFAVCAQTRDSSGPSGYSKYFNGKYAEVIAISSAVNATTRQLIEGYLAHKWGLEGSLPGGHPYKSSAPTV